MNIFVVSSYVSINCDNCGPATPSATACSAYLPTVPKKLTMDAIFLEDLIDACVIECYFREHIVQRNLLWDYSPDKIPF